MKKFILYLLIIINCIACMDKFNVNNLTISNDSDKEIIYSLSNTDTIFDLKKMKNYQASQGDIFLLFVDSLEKKKTKIIDPRPPHWKSYYDPDNKGNKMRLFIIEKDSLDKYGWEGIYQKNLYNAKYLLNNEKLDSLNWTIIYKGR